MSKKMTNLIEKFEERIELYYQLYLDGVFTAEEVNKHWNNMEIEFNYMRSGMFNYGLLSEKEYLESSGKSIEIVFRYEDKTGY